MVSSNYLVDIRGLNYLENFHIPIERIPAINTAGITGIMPLEHNHMFVFKKLIVPETGFRVVVLSFLSTAVKTQETYTAVCKQEGRGVFNFFQKKSSSHVLTMHNKWEVLLTGCLMVLEDPRTPDTYVFLEEGFDIGFLCETSYQEICEKAQKAIEKVFIKSSEITIEKQGALKEAEAKEKREPKKEGQGEPKRSKPSKCLVM